MALGKLGKYERVDVLGHGASGIVYLAWDTLLKKQVALKEIDLQAGDVGRFLEEARVMDRLSHPNIVRVNGVDKIDGHIVIDMEYVKGDNLQQLLRREGRLPVARAIDVAIQTLDALDYAHRMRTVHRDIKPANILLSRQDEVKLVDFGLAEILATNSYAGGAGTYAYMAPEDFAEEHHSDHLSDIWAVGVTLYEMLTGARPFTVTKAKDPFSWRRVLLHERPARLTEAPEMADVDFPAGLQGVLDRALARNKSDRYPTAGAFRDDLKAIRAGSAPALEPLVAVEVGAAAHYNGTASEAGALPFLLPTDRNATAGVPYGSAPPVPLGSAPAPPLLQEQTVSGSTLPAAQAQGASAQIVEEPRRRGGLRLPFGRKEVQPVTVAVEPQAIHFGEVRKGDERQARIQLRFQGGEGGIQGRVISVPAWASVFPPTINRRKQSLTITAFSDRVWQTGDFEEAMRIETPAGEVQVPLAIRVLKARPRFSEVAAWFVPLFLAVLLPALTVAWGAQFPGAKYLVPAAALGSGLLAAMLLLVAVEADLGFAEKMACGVLLAVMTMVLGVTMGVAGRTGHTAGLQALPATGVPMGVILAIQVFQRKNWRLWAGAIVALAMIAAGTFARVLAG
jgi:serine/threonine protein kinase